MSPIGQVDAITLDCPDPQSLAAFYRTVTGWETVFDTHEYVYLAGEGSFQLGFQRVPGQRPPAWPSPVA
jgi:catechol 2,3-dioxygenase-like lactoylglutathione lyase family enzyme